MKRYSNLKEKDRLLISLTFGAVILIISVGTTINVLANSVFLTIAIASISFITISAIVIAFINWIDTFIEKEKTILLIEEMNKNKRI